VGRFLWRASWRVSVGLPDSLGGYLRGEPPLVARKPILSGRRTNGHAKRRAGWVPPAAGNARLLQRMTPVFADIVTGADCGLRDVIFRSTFVRPPSGSVAELV
jgi:hypothetical protein